MNNELIRKKGAPRGNQNARKHGFYSRVLTVPDKHRLKKAALITGLDEEINLLRVKIRAVVQHDPDNLRLILQALVSLARLLRTRQSLGDTDGTSLLAAMENVNTYVAQPLGYDVFELIRSRHNKENNNSTLTK